MSGSNHRPVLLVEDDEDLRAATAQSLSLAGFAVTPVGAGRAALRHVSRDFQGAVISDVRMPGMDGIELAERLREIDPEIPILFVTGHGDLEMAVAAMRAGAIDFLAKPFPSDRLVRSARLAVDRRRLILENRSLRSELGRQTKQDILGTSPAVERIRALVTAVADSEIDAVVRGQPGVGKSFVARLIHDLSARHGRPFVTIDAAILAHRDCELLVFGRDPADGLSRTGLIERANGGTLHLRDIDLAKRPMQARLMSMIEQRSILPLGAERARKLNIRVVLAEAAPREGGGIAERLDAVSIDIPPLAARREDIAVAFRHFVAEHERAFARAAPPMGETEWQRIQTHAWPGNLRELNSFARDFTLGLTEIKAAPAMLDGKRTLQEMVADFERTILEDALRACEGRVSRVEEALGTPRKTLYDKLAKHAIRPQDFRKAGG